MLFASRRASLVEVLKLPWILLKSNCSQTLRKITQSQSFVCLNGRLQVRGRERRGSSQRALGPPYPGWRRFNCFCLYAGFGLRDWPIKESEKFEQNGVNFTFAPTINHGPSVASGPELDFIEAEVLRLKHEANDVASYFFLFIMGSCVTSETRPICFVPIKKV